MKKDTNELIILLNSLSLSERKIIELKLTSSKKNIPKQLYEYYTTTRTNQSKNKSQHIDVQLHSKQNKYRLFHFVLEILEHEHHTIDPYTSIEKSILKIKILKEKYLYKKAKSLILKTLEKAKKYEFFALEIELLTLLQTLPLEFENLEGFNKDFLHFRKLQLETFDKYKQSIEHRLIINSLKSISLVDGWYGNFKSLDSVSKLYQQLKNTEIIYRKKNKSLRLTLEILGIEYYCHLLMNNFEISEKKFVRFFNLYKQVSFEMKEIFFHINTGITICILNGNKSLFDQLLIELNNNYNKFNTLAKLNKQELDTAFFSVKNNEIAFYTHFSKFKKAKNISYSIYDSITKKHIRSSVQKIFLANLCQIHLCTSEPNQSIAIYLKIKSNNYFTKIRLDINPGLDLLALAAFYDLNYMSNLNSLLRSLRRNLSKPHYTAKVIADFYYFFKTIIKETESKNKLNHFLKLRNTIISKYAPYSESYYFLKNTLILNWVNLKIKKFKFNNQR